MMDGIDKYYHDIADAISSVISEPWTLAIAEAVFYPNSISLYAEYTRPSGEVVSFGTASSGDRAFRELRKKFKEAGKPIWGQATFKLHHDGKFTMKWGYDNCDANGDTIFESEQWLREQELRRQRIIALSGLPRKEN